jgi:hypothetical protein
VWDLLKLAVESSKTQIGKAFYAQIFSNDRFLFNLGSKTVKKAVNGTGEKRRI